MAELTSLALLVVKPSLWSMTIACLNCSLLTQLFIQHLKTFSRRTCTFTYESRSDHCEQALFARKITFPRTIYQTGVGKKTLQNAGHHFQALISVLMRFMEHFPGVNLVWSVLVAANPSLLLVTSVGPRCSHSTHSSFCCSGVNVHAMLLRL
ncbi:hypothetical protein CFP56_012296 [Quercus suber]|uniref:Secreted protein n=1 Tax=Quercus suber TaxID=58331 RepID=A0AAW0M5T0_QUESU